MLKSLQNVLKLVAILLTMAGLFSVPVSASNSTQKCWWSSYERDQPGVYGTKGVPSQSNVPGARCDAARWTDQEGNFWLMGGWGIAAAKGKRGHLNDLWKYNPRDNTWTWVGGSSEINQPGTKGVPSQPNISCGRTGAAHWTDQEGNFWLMGGVGSATEGKWGTFNDLWKYNPRDNTWTWVGGSSDIDQPSVYGTKGVPSQSNVPGARCDAAHWTDQEGNFRLMGGWGNIGIVFGDLWKYNPRDNTWTWVAGSDKERSSPDYGINSDPGSRFGTANWTDQEGNFWLMGGNGAYMTIMALDDFWKFNPLDNTWNCVLKEGIDGHGVFGKKGVPSQSNRPGSNSDAAHWTDQEGNFWLMGGLMKGQESISALWKYNPRDNTWTWMAGSNEPGEPAVYDSWIYSPYPGARFSAAHWTDQEGNFWLMGGKNSNMFRCYYLNDLWKYNPRTNKWTWVRK